MKIISKYKDYYDYLQGIYGVDEKLVLDRTEGTSKDFPSYSGLHVLVICNKILEYVCFNNKFYFGKNIEQFNEFKLLENWGTWKGIKPVYLINPHKTPRSLWELERVYYPKLSEDIYNIYPKLKDLSKSCPIFIYHKTSNTIYTKFPSLLELGVNKEIEAQEIWLMLTEWLSNKVTENEPIVPTGDDAIRIKSAGFDLKTSFRPNIKK